MKLAAKQSHRAGGVMPVANCKVRFARMAALGAEKTIRRWTETAAHAHAALY
jgi:hypothetical protein